MRKYGKAKKPLFESADGFRGTEGFPFKFRYEKVSGDGPNSVWHVGYVTNCSDDEDDMNLSEIERTLGKDAADKIAAGEGELLSDGSRFVDNTAGADFSDAESADELAKKLFGTTTDFSKAGWLLRDGTMLDFSEGQDRRTLDHRGVGQMRISSDKAARMDLDKFMALGNVRLTPELPGASFSTPMSDAQKRVLASLIGRYGRRAGYFDVDALRSDGTGDAAWSKEYDPPYAQMVLRDIDAWFSYGTIPPGADSPGY